MAKALTAKAVEQARPAPDKRREIPDGLLTGLYLVVQPEATSGAKSWAVRYRHGGKSRKLTLGSYPAVELGDARDAAKAALQVVAKGADPALQKQDARREAKEGRDLLENVVAEFLARHVAKKKSRHETERMLNHDILPRWRGRRIQDITRRDVIALLDGLQDRGVGVMTNRVFSIIRKLFNWAISRDIISASPCVGIKSPVQEESRERTLDDNELRLVWLASGMLGYPFGPIVRMLILTGQRLGEVSGLPWSEIDLDRASWSLPRERTKNGRAHEVPLSLTAIKLLKRLPRIASTRKLVFTTTGKTPVSGFSRAKARLDQIMLKIARKEVVERGGDPEKVHIEPWTLHDLRRTLATGLQRLAVQPHVTEAVLNHKSGIIKGVAAVYARHDYAAEKRTALDAWARRVSEIVTGKTTDNVVAFDRARA